MCEISAACRLGDNIPNIDLLRLVLILDRTNSRFSQQVPKLFAEVCQSSATALNFFLAIDSTEGSNSENFGGDQYFDYEYADPGENKGFRHGFRSSPKRELLGSSTVFDGICNWSARAFSGRVPILSSSRLFQSEDGTFSTPCGCRQQ